MGAEETAAPAVVVACIIAIEACALGLAATISETGCQSKPGHTYLVHPQERALRLAPVGTTLLGLVIMGLLMMSVITGGTACPGLLMDVTLPATAWTASILVSLYRFTYPARITGMSTTALASGEAGAAAQAQAQSASEPSPGLHGLYPGAEASRGPQFMWEIYRTPPEDAHAMAVHTGMAFLGVALWHMLVFMIAAGQDYSMYASVADCHINDLEVTLATQALLLLGLTGLGGVYLTRVRGSEDPDYIGLRRVCHFCPVMAFAVFVIIVVPGAATIGFVLVVVLFATVAWSILCILHLSPYIPELDDWLAGWVIPTRLPPRPRMPRLPRIPRRRPRARSKDGGVRKPMGAVDVFFTSSMDTTKRA